MGLSFDLVDEPWLPVLVKDGRRDLLSIRRALVEAHEVGELVDQSPPVTAALHRLLLAILHRVFGPRNAHAWWAIWAGGRLDREPIDEYLDRWRPRFNLFHAARPFYQAASLPTALANPVAILLPERASGNNATLFDHSLDDQPQPISSAEAARRVVAMQAYALGGLLTREKVGDRSADGAPLVKLALIQVRGRDLFQTLCLNLHRYEPELEIPFASVGADLPAWEVDHEPSPAARIPKGYLDLLTWQSRRIRLLPDEGSSDSPTVSRAVVTKGHGFPKAFQLKGRETMAGFRMVKKPTGGQEPWQPIGFRQDRAIWRDSTALLARTSEAYARAPILDWLADLSLEGTLPPPSLDVLGMVSDRASVLLWRHERLPLPLRYLQDQKLMESLSLALDTTEKAAHALRESLLALAATIVPAPSQGLASPSPESRKSRDVFVDRLDAGTWYWSAVEAAFRRHMVELEADRSEDSELGVRYGLEVLPKWRRILRRAASAAFEEAVRGLDTTARTLHGVVLAERQLAWRLDHSLKDLKLKEVPADAHRA